MIRIYLLIGTTTFLTSWISYIIYENYHGGGFSAWLQWHATQMQEALPWWILLAWATGHPHV